MAQRRLADAQVSELLGCGPFLGIDASTTPYFVSEFHATDSINLLPNKAFGGFTTCQGRSHAFAANFASQLYGFFKYQRTGQADTYIAAVNSGGAGILQQAALGGTPAALTMPSGVTWGQSHETSFTPYQNWLFATNGNDTPVKIDTSLAMTRWGIVAPGAPTVATGGAGNLNGTYHYIVTYFNAFQESSGGTVSAAVSPSNQSVSLSAIPVSTDPQVTGRNIYRFGGTMQNTQLVGTITDNTTTTFTDNLADTSVTGQTLVQYRDPPQAFLAINTHQGRTWGFGYTGTAVGEPTSISGTSDLWYSNYEEPWGFNSVDQVIPIGRNSGGDIAVEVVSYMNVLYCLKSKTFWAIYGSTPADYTPTLLYPKGCAGKKSVVEAYGLLFWATPEKSIVMFNAMTLTDISDNRTTNTGSSIKGVLETFSAADMAACTGAAYDQGVIFSFPTQGISYYYNIADGQWYKLSFSTDRVVFDVNNIEVTAAEPGTGTVDSWFSAWTDLGSNITSTYISRITDSKLPQSTKRYRYVELMAPIQTATASVTVTVNPGTGALTNTQTVDLSAAPERHTISLPPSVGSGQMAQLTIAVTGAQQTSIYHAGLFGWIERNFVSKG
ncbi:MAG: hypothetical protein KGL39_12985 [Patescibacteria group bacterium]|nr:hypothetical protein [Patescibacteria group bacterium]